MAGISSSTGLITGIPIQDTVNKLMQVASQPHDQLDARNKTLQSEQVAVSQLSSLVLALKFDSDKLGKASLFQTKAVASTDTSILNASVATNGNPPVGSYKFRVLQTASSQQLLSGGLESLDDLATSGKLTIGFGGFVDKGVALTDLNGGAGVSAGIIRITDRAGNSANIDLRTAKTIDDVLRAINDNTTIDVTAATDGDRITLADSTGGTGNLRVQQVGSGNTAADLGLGGINVAADSATGADIFALGQSTKLTSLNNGTGVELKSGNDLQVTLADGTAVSIDLGDATTIGDVLTKLNTASPTKLSASIAADGGRLQLNDLTSGSQSFAVENVGNGTAATDLGLATTASGATISGRRLIGGLQDSLVSGLHGGQGLGILGDIAITNRHNVSSTVHLAGKESLREIIDAINQQATGVSASINSARNGIVLTDTTGATASNLIVADGDATNTATNLGIVADVAANTKNSGNLGRQQVGRATLLSTLNQGAGVSIRDIRITDSAGHTNAADLNQIGNDAKTLGDVIDRINGLSNIEVEARINDTGDGIVLIDKAGGSGKLTVAEVGTGKAATDLHILGTGVSSVINGQTVQAIDGTSRHTIDLSNLDQPGSNISLASLNKGEGIQFGAFKITDSSGHSGAVVINKSSGTFNTVADVINAINNAGVEVDARMDSSGSGILLVDKAGGGGTLKVEELAGGTTAANLGLTADVKSITVDGAVHQTIDGVARFTQPTNQGALGALASRINALGIGVTASAVHDSTGYRLSLSVDKTGAGQELLVDGLNAGLNFSEFTAARDAVIEFGGTQLGTGVAIASSTNKFNDVVSGLQLTAVAPSDKTVSVDVTASSTAVASAAQDFVDAYNSIRSTLDDTTSFDSTALTTGILFGSTAALRVDSDLSRLLSGTFSGLGKFSSLQAVGFSFDDKGKLSLDKTKLQDAFDSDPDALSNFFSRDTLGVSAKVSAAADRLAGTDSVLSARSDALKKTVDGNTEQLTKMSDQLDKQRQRLLAQFAALETTVAKMQESLTALSSIQYISPLYTSSSNSLTG